jgi:hypothetical protein
MYPDVNVYLINTFKVVDKKGLIYSGLFLCIKKRVHNLLLKSHYLA